MIIGYKNIDNLLESSSCLLEISHHFYTLLSKIQIEFPLKKFFIIVSVECFLQLYDYASFYLAMDQNFVFDQFRTDLQYLKSNWQMLGRPTMILPIFHWMSGIFINLFL